MSSKGDKPGSGPGRYIVVEGGRSKKQPFCDGSHKGTGFEPVAWKAAEAGPVWFCGCKRTKGRPCCDGSHNAL